MHRVPCLDQKRFYICTVEKMCIKSIIEILEERKLFRTRNMIKLKNNRFLNNLYFTIRIQD